VPPTGNFTSKRKINIRQVKGALNFNLRRNTPPYISRGSTPWRRKLFPTGGGRKTLFFHSGKRKRAEKGGEGPAKKKRAYFIEKCLEVGGGKKGVCGNGRGIA